MNKTLSTLIALVALTACDTTANQPTTVAQQSKPALSTTNSTSCASIPMVGNRMQWTGVTGANITRTGPETFFSVSQGGSDTSKECKVENGKFKVLFNWGWFEYSNK